MAWRTFFLAAALACTALLPAHPARAEPSALPPAPMWRQDPADGLYRSARDALNRRDYAGAARLFQRIRREHPRSRYTPDALYWEAFARYRTGAPAELRTALGALDTQRTRYPRASTRGDADELAARIRGELARRGDTDAARQVERSAALAARSCGDDAEVASLNALMRMSPDRALPVLERVLARRDECSVELRKKAVFILSRQTAGVAEPVLMRVARADPSADVRGQAIVWLSASGSDRSLRFIEETLRTSDDAEVRERALFALSRHPSPRAQAALRAAAEESGVPRELRERALHFIGDRGTPESVEYLRGFFGRTEDVGLRTSLLPILARQRGGGRWLLSVAGEASQPAETRRQALYWAGRLDVPTAELAAAYDGLRGAELREQALFVLAHRGDAAAVAKLNSVARADPDPAMRARARFWLARVR